MLTSLHARMLLMTHPTNNGTEMVVRWAMHQIPASSLHNLAEPAPHLTRLLCLLVLRVLQALPDHVRRAQIPRGGSSRRTPRMDRHTLYTPFLNLTCPWSHCRVPLRMQARKRSSLSVNHHRNVHPLGSMLSVLLNTVSRVARVINQR